MSCLDLPCKTVRLGLKGPRQQCRPQLQHEHARLPCRTLLAAPPLGGTSTKSVREGRCLCQCLLHVIYLSFIFASHPCCPSLRLTHGKALRRLLVPPLPPRLTLAQHSPLSPLLPLPLTAAAAAGGTKPVARMRGRDPAGLPQPPPPSLLSASSCRQGASGAAALAAGPRQPPPPGEGVSGEGWVWSELVRARACVCVCVCVRGWGWGRGDLGAGTRVQCQATLTAQWEAVPERQRGCLPARVRLTCRRAAARPVLACLLAIPRPLQRRPDNMS